MGMTMLSRALAIFVLVGSAFAATGSVYTPACKSVAAAISKRSSVNYPGSIEYNKGKRHFAASSEDDPACVVEPGTPEDVGKILNVIQATKTPFAVMSGGHTINPGFSSTKGIHIYLGRFSQVTYDETSGTVVIGGGLIWDEVYQKLQTHDVNVVGGRVTGVGVGGFLLGGGYSYKTNQYGLSIDSIVGFNLVLPNGTVTHVTQSNYPDLFFGLKGGFNNFGIVTDFTMKAFPQTKVWGGQVSYGIFRFDEVREAIANFSLYSKDEKAAILPSYISYLGIKTINVGIFYDGPTPPPGTFDNFTKIKPLSKNLKTRSYLDLVLTPPANFTSGLRGSWQMLGVSHFSNAFLKAVQDEHSYWSDQSRRKSGIFFSYNIEPFLSSYLSHANSPSAWPTATTRRSIQPPNPLLVYFGWTEAHDDAYFVSAIEESVNRLSVVAQADGSLASPPLPLYGNYVDFKTPLVDIYGDNLPVLQALKAKVDPNNVMGLAGGFKFVSNSNAYPLFRGDNLRGT